jgi:hypothetical protein
MDEGMNMKKIGIWIDHRRAVVVTIDEGGESRHVVESDIERHAGPEGSRRTSTPYGPQATSLERRMELKNRLRITNFFKKVIKGLGQPDHLLVMGPAKAKREFVELLKKTGGRRVKVKMETADRMTEAQVAAKVRKTEF